MATVFFTIFGAALFMEWAGLSMSVGAFLLGMLLSGSEFQHTVESIVSPLKLALLDLFFIAVGMSMDLALTPVMVKLGDVFCASRLVQRRL